MSLESARIFSFLVFLFLQFQESVFKNPIHKPRHRNLFEFPQAIKPRNQFFVDLRTVHRSCEDLYEICVLDVMTLE